MTMRQYEVNGSILEMDTEKELTPEQLQAIVKIIDSTE